MFPWMSQITWEKGAWMHTAVKSVCIVLALSAVEQSTGSHQGAPVLPGDKLLRSSPGAGAVLAIVATPGESFLINPTRRNH